MQILFWLLRGLRQLLRGALSLIRDYPWQAITVGLVLGVLLVSRQWAIDHRDLTDELSAERALVAEIRKTHSQTVENVRKGREAARELDRQNAARVAAEAAAINERLTDELETRARTYAARSDRLRAQLATLEASAGGSGAAPVPNDSAATCRAFGAADCDQLAARMIDGQASIDKLIALQAWAKGVTAIETNGE